MKKLSISKNHLKAIRYDIYSAVVIHNVEEHPQAQMAKLGINLIKAIPESMGDCWICLTDYQGELPEYIKEIELKPHDSYWSHMCDVDIVK